MPYNNGIITAPVSVYDIQNAIGSQSGDLGTLILYGNINMWAKFKPVCKEVIDTTPQLNSDNSWNGSVSNPWWKGTLNDYGIAYAGGMVTINFQRSGIIDALTSILSKINGGLNGWTYVHPAGGRYEPFRYLDFNRYNAYAKNPISGLTAQDVAASATSEFSAMIDYRESGSGVPVEARDHLVPEDIIGSGWYLGFAIYKRSGNSYTPIAWVTGTKEWQGLGINSSSGPDGIIAQDDNIAITKLMNGATYYALPVFSTIQLSQPAPNQSRQIDRTGQRFLTVPFTSLVSFTATQRGTSQMVAVPRITNRTITRAGTFTTSYVLDSTYDGYYGGRLYNVEFLLVNELYNGTLAQGNYADYQVIGTVDVGSDEVKTVYTISPAKVLDLNHTWRVILWAGGESKTVGLIAPAPINPTA